MFSFLTKLFQRKEPVQPAAPAPVQEPEQPEELPPTVEPVNPAGPPPDKTPVPGAPKREKLVGFILPKVAEVLTDWIREDQKLGKARSCSVDFSVYREVNRGRFLLAPSSARPGERLLRVGVFRKGSDRVVEHFISTGSDEETLAYLNDPDNLPEWAEELADLERSVDEYCD